jgi:hypothetical protein
MRSETELADSVYGFTWCLTDGQHYVRNADGDIRAVNEQTVELLRLFARGELTRQALCRQRDGGPAVLDEASAVDPETVIDLFDRYREDGFLRPDDPVVRLHPPAEVRLWPRLVATLVPIAVVCWVFAGTLPTLRGLAADPPGVWLLVGLFPATMVFVAVHEFGHYAAASRPLAALPVAAAVVAGVATPFSSLLLAAVVADLVFALNPLFHGDGYWIAADLLGAENVRTRGMEALRRREPTWPAVYVVVSYAVGAAFLLNVVAVTVAVGGVRGLLSAAPVVLLLVFAWADVEVRGS